MTRAVVGSTGCSLQLLPRHGFTVLAHSPALVPVRSAQTLAAVWHCITDVCSLVLTDRYGYTDLGHLGQVGCQPLSDILGDCLTGGKFTFKVGVWIKIGITQRGQCVIQKLGCVADIKYH